MSSPSDCGLAEDPGSWACNGLVSVARMLAIGSRPVEIVTFFLLHTVSRRVCSSTTLAVRQPRLDRPLHVLRAAVALLRRAGPPGHRHDLRIRQAGPTAPPARQIP